MKDFISKIRMWETNVVVVKALPWQMISMDEKIDFFALFELPSTFQQAREIIQSRFYQLQQKMHPDNYVNATPQEKRLALEYAALVNEAYKTLRSPLSRAVYLLKLRGCDVLDETNTSMPMEFLAAQMDLQERLATCQASNEDESLQRLQKEIEEALMACEERIFHLLDKSPDIQAACLWVQKMQFYQRLQEKIAAHRGKML